MRRHSAISMSLGLAVVLLLGSPALLTAKDVLTLRVDDAEGEPGDVATVVIRTYAPRTVGQGQICLRADSPPDSSLTNGPRKAAGVPIFRVPDAGASSLTNESPIPWLELESYAVLSSEGDAISEGAFDAPAQTAFLVFESLSGTINSDDGPLAVLFFRIAEEAPVDTEFDISLDAADTFLIDAAGVPLELELRPGKLKILKP